jgi:urease accessory protein UreF
MTKTWTKEEVINLLQNNDAAIGRALVRLNERQTADEAQKEITKYRNGKGFRPCHARMGTSMAKFYESKGFLTPKQAAYWRVKDKSGKMRIGIYAGQLLEVIEKGA